MAVISLPAWRYRRESLFHTHFLPWLQFPVQHRATVKIDS